MRPRLTQLRCAAQVIGRDMAPFLILLGIIIVGSMFFFVICNPSSSAFGYNEASLGALWPLFTVFLASMGNPIDVLGTDDFGTWPAILMLCGFLFFVVIILCASLSSPSCWLVYCAECLLAAAQDECADRDHGRLVRDGEGA